VGGSNLSGGVPAPQGSLPGLSQPKQQKAPLCDPAICSSVTPPTQDPPGSSVHGKTLPNTGAPTDSMPLAALGLAMALAGAVLMRRRPAMHRA
ncbi:MAG: LPXTG cell wall anchor domain-containing protein, partial [Acidimicrobiales bacterium]